MTSWRTRWPLRSKADGEADRPLTERTVLIKLVGHWERAHVHVHRGDLFIDVPPELIRLVEADRPGYGEKFGYQLLIERLSIAEFFRDDLRWRGEMRRWRRPPLRARIMCRLLRTIGWSKR